MNREKAIQATYLLLRVVAALLFIQVGGSKLFGWFGVLPKTMFPSGTVPLMSQLGLAGVLEVFGGAAIMLGLYTRPAAFILSGEMAVAYFQFHQPKGAWPVLNQGMPAVLFCFIFLCMAAQGAGDWSVDAILQRRRRGPARAQ